jgi:hypothetical protein
MAPGLETHRPIRAATRQQHADGSTLVNGSQRAEKMVDRHVLPGHRRARGQRQYAIAEGHIGVGRDQRDMVGTDGHALGDLMDRQGGHAPDNFSEVALMVRINVHHKEYDQARIDGQILQHTR